MKAVAIWLLVAVAAARASSAAASAASLPSVIQIVADDLGFNDVWHLGENGQIEDNPLTYTPHINKLLSEGIALTAYHTYKVCSPSRASILTGRYPWGVGYYDMKGPEAIPLSFALLPELLKTKGYRTAALGKWNLGHLLKPYTPTRRGFDTFVGYYAACQVDYWYHGSPPNQCGVSAPGDPITDFSNSTTETIGPAYGLNGTYNAEIFAAAAEKLIGEHAASFGADTPLYVYLAFMNVHGAANMPELALQAPQETVELYNRTVLDTYKVAGGMITELDTGVGRVHAALDAAGMLQNSIITFCSDNGGPLDHATNAPLRGGKHTLWDGGLRVTAFVWSPLLPQTRQGQPWGGLMHASDWLPTIAFGIAGVNSGLARGPRLVDGHNMWPAWTSPNTTSPRTEIIHQVVNQYCNGTDKGTSVAPFGNTIRMGRFKLISGAPGQATILPWPQPSGSVVPFGQSNGTVEPGTDHYRAGGVEQAPTKVMCNPHCLFDLEADPSETHDLALDPAHASDVARLLARVREAAATGPPWAFPINDTIPLEQEICASAATTGFYEPVREVPPPPPSPAPPQQAVQYTKGGLCLTVTPRSEAQILPTAAMGPCNSRAMWTHGWVRGQPTLQNQYLHEMSAPNFTTWCLHIGVWPQNMTCRYDGTQHTPGIRQCTEGTPAGGGNPVGSGFNFTGEMIQALSCEDAPNICLGTASGEAALRIVQCTDPAAAGWSMNMVP